MRKVALVLALLFCADVALDSFDADCAQMRPDRPCHACFCQTHILPAPALGERLAAPSPTSVAPAREPLVDRLIDKTLFRPPKAPA